MLYLWNEWAELYLGCGKTFDGVSMMRNVNGQSRTDNEVKQRLCAVESKIF